MKKLFLFFLFCLTINFRILAQQASKINIGSGYSFNVNGNLSGFNLNFGYVIDFNRWFALEANLRGESETKIDYYVYDTFANEDWLNPTGSASTELKLSNGGLQLEVLPKLKLVDNNFKLNLIAGGLLRYTLSQMPRSYSVYFPALTHLPEPIYEIFYHSKPNLFEPGFAVGLEIGAAIGPRSTLTARLLTTNTSQQFIYNFPIVYYYQLN